jgi:arginine decarboxylase
VAVRQPLVEAMLQYREQQVYPLHTPGHKGGRGMAEPLKSQLGLPALALDVSLMAELDDIHQPEGCLKEAQELAAKLYGSDACFFAVNGTTEAIHALLLTALNPGEQILIPRNAHRSVAGALVLAGAEPLYVWPGYVPEFGLSGQITAAQVEQELSAHPQVKAVFVTSPNYYGLAADVAAIAQSAHAHGAVLLVDEAHGPHLGFTKKLPPSALQSGADACAQSTHKLVGAMTQCSMLQVQGKRLDVQRAAEVMSLLTTTSPNYLLMASLDAARAQLEARGAAMGTEALQCAQVLRTALATLPGLKILGQQVVGHAGIAAVDLTKVTVNFRNWGLSGVEVAAWLRKYKLAVELADAENVLFLVTYADATPAWPAIVTRIVAALKKLRQQNSGGEKNSAPQILSGRPKLVVRNSGDEKNSASQNLFTQLPHVQPQISPRQIFYGARETVPLTQAAGRICAESVAFYPPGIPVVAPGEIVSPELIAYCQEMLRLNLVVHGAADATLQTLRVLRP